MNPCPVLGQKEANNWLLGPVGGITFRSGEAQKLTEIAVDASFVKSSISDSEGNLLFYTNGKKVWDRNHRVMPNGNNLKGTSYTSCEIIPKPGDPNRFYIFTTMGNERGAPFEAAYYSEVDLCLNSGFGDIVEATKDTPLVSIAGVRSAAVKHRNGIDYWIAFHKFDSNAFYCYLITSDGIDLTPVISQTGSYLRLTGYSTGDGGEMKFSPDGKRLAIAITQSATAEVFDFDSQTGILSNPLHIPAMYRQNHYTPDYTHGVEFSPDGQKLYLSRTTGTLLLQYDLSAGDKTSILKSRTIIAGDTLQHDNPHPILHGMQLGPDGKIYINSTRAGIWVILKPNEKGLACQYQENIINWGINENSPKYFHSFPSFIASYFNPTVLIKHGFDCYSPTVRFSLGYTNSRDDSDVAEIRWYFDDLASGASNESDQVNASHTFLSAGLHTIRANIQWTDGTQQEIKHQITIPPDVVNGKRYGLGNDTTLCPGQSLRLDASHTGGEVTWQDGSTKDYFDVTSPGIYWVRVCKAGCSITDSVTVSMEDISDFLGKDTVLCGKQSILLNAGSIGEVIGWQDNSVSSTYTITKPGIYWVNVLKNNCILTDSLVVTSCDKDLFIPNVITPNGDGLNDRFSIESIDNESWSLSIFNRYGKEVYNTNVYKNDWDGATLRNGTYYYYLCHNLTGKSYNGWVQIIR